MNYTFFRYNLLVRNILLTIICGLVVFLLSYFGLYLKNLASSNQNLLSPIVNLETPSSELSSTDSIEINSYYIVWEKIEDLSKISLFSNLTDQKTAKVLYKENKCKTLVNSGFYSKEGNHIGLFISNGNKISLYEKNSLFNGVFSLDNNVASINLNETNSNNALQAGPVLIFNGVTRNLSIKNDENERRMVIAITENSEVLFLAIYKKESTYLGPKLAELPDLLINFSQKTSLKIKSALNLDGGTASAFYTKGLSLGELTKIGGYFCIK